MLRCIVSALLNHLLLNDRKGEIILLENRNDGVAEANRSNEVAMVGENEMCDEYKNVLAVEEIK